MNLITQQFMNHLRGYALYGWPLLVLRVGKRCYLGKLVVSILVHWEPMSHRKSRKIRIGSLGGPFLLYILRKEWPKKFHGIILLHLGLVTFGYHIGKTLKPFIVMMSGPSGRDRDSPNPIIYIFADTKLLQTAQAENRIDFEK